MKIVIIADLSSTVKSVDGSSYIEKLYGMFSRKYNDVLVQCTIEAYEAISRVIAPKQIMVEPFQRGTAAAIGLATAYIANTNPKETIVYIFANQNIAYEDNLLITLGIARDMYKHLGRMLLVGVAMTDNVSDYGFIKVGKVLQEISGLVAFELSSFYRSPTDSLKAEIAESWRYLWDTGCMICRAENLLEIYKDTLPEMFTGLMTIKASIGTKFEKQIVETVYEKFPKLSMSKGVYEKVDATKVAVISVDLGITKNLEH